MKTNDTPSYSIPAKAIVISPKNFGGDLEAMAPDTFVGLDNSWVRRVTGLSARTIRRVLTETPSAFPPNVLQVFSLGKRRVLRLNPARYIRHLEERASKWDEPQQACTSCSEDAEEFGGVGGRTDAAKRFGAASTPKQASRSPTALTTKTSPSEPKGSTQSGAARLVELKLAAYRKAGAKSRT
jgi:hypothetical protein